MTKEQYLESLNKLSPQHALGHGCTYEYNAFTRQDIIGIRLVSQNDELIDLQKRIISCIEQLCRNTG